MMGAKYFFYLYLRNAKGVFFAGFVDTPVYQYAAPLIWLGHLALLPLTLTIAAFAKSLFDFCTRNPVGLGQLTSTKEGIQAMDKEAMDKLVQGISAYGAKSNSSQRLLRKLNQLTIEEKKAVEEGYAAKKESLAWDQLNDKEQKKYQPQYVAALELDENHQDQLQQYDSANKNKIVEVKLGRQRELIVKYMNQEKNQGKKMLQLIVGIFNQPVAKEGAPQKGAITYIPLG